MTRHGFQILALTIAQMCVVAAPAAAQRYTAKQDGDVVTLEDTTAKMHVAVVASMGKAWQIQVNGQNLVRTSPSLESFLANSGLNGMPLLAPFANRLDETAFYANGKKFTFDLGLGNVRGPIPGTGFVNGSKTWQLVDFKADGKSAWVTCRLDFYKTPEFMKQFPFAHTITLTYRVADGTLEVHTRLDNLSNEPMPAVIGFHPIYELPDGNRDDWTVSVDAKTHWLEIPERLPTGETQPTEEFFNADKSRTAIKLKNYALIDDVFSDLIRDSNGRATMRLMYDGKELDETLGPKFKTVLLWSTPLSAGNAGGGGRGAGGASGRGGAGRGGAQGATPAPSGPFPVDPAQGAKNAPPAVPAAAGAAPLAAKGFIAFEPMVAITDALNLAQQGTYKALQTIPVGGSWEESFWITTKGY
jgi:aldose 1-epimerase